VVAFVPFARLSQVKERPSAPVHHNLTEGKKGNKAEYKCWPMKAVLPWSTLRRLQQAWALGSDSTLLVTLGKGEKNPTSVIDFSQFLRPLMPH